MNLPSNAIIIWGGTNASIPAGTTRETQLDGKFIKGTATAIDPNVTGGNATHTHTTPSHTHTLVAHTHSTSLSAASGGNKDSGFSSQGGAPHNHTHADITSGAVSNATVSSETPTTGTESNNPPYYEVIFVKSDGTTGIPNDCIVYQQSTTIPSGFNITDGTSGTINLIGKYLRGAPASGDAGGTGGSTTNTHTLPHGHNTSHQHVSASTGGINSVENDTDTGTNDMVSSSHTHTVSYNAYATTTTDTPAIITSEIVEPEHTEMIAVQNISGGVISVQPNAIVMWLGTLASVPTGWSLCDGTSGTPDLRDQFIKINSTSGLTGGSNIHTHELSHAHTAISHTHTTPNVTHVNSVAHDNHGFGGATSTSIHTVTASNSDQTLASSTMTSGSANNEPEYVTVAYIMNVTPKFEKHVSLLSTEESTSSASYTVNADGKLLYQYTAGNYSDIEAVYLECMIKDDSGTATVGLHTDADVLVTGAEVATTNTTSTRVRSGNILGALVSGTDYHIKYKSSGTLTVRSAKLIFVQQGSGITTETQVELSQCLNSTATYTLPNNYGVWKYDASRFDGTVTVYTEATLKASNAARTVYAQLYNLTTSTAVTGSEVTHTGDTKVTRVRSSDILGNLVDGDEYAFQVKGDSGELEDVICCRVIIVQSGTVTKTDCYLPTNTIDSSTTSTVVQSLNQIFNYDNSNWTASSISYSFESTAKIVSDESTISRSFVIGQVDF